MKNSLKIFVTFLIFVSSMLFLAGCSDKSQVTDDDNEVPEVNDKVKLSGQVISKSTGLSLDSVLVRVLGASVDLIMYTDSDGKFSFEFPTTTTTSLSVIAYRNNYQSDTTYLTATVGSTVTVPVIKLNPVSTPVTNTSLPAASILLLSASPNNINVRESGGVENSTIVFVVLDSLGRPITLLSQCTVNFKLALNLGGEFVYPLSAKTNESGQVSVNLISGTKAGVVHIYAEINTSTGKIISRPVYVSIHGGLPDLAHFSLGPEAFNFPGLDVYGLKDAISVIVGDKFGNPVKPNTSVYFTTTGGIIEGSVLTNLEGRGTVNLISGNPEPNHVDFGPGFATITGSTSNENLETINKSTVVLFSGAPIITVSPSTFDIPNGGRQNFTFTVSDRNGNPLAAGNKITVGLEGDNAEIQGDVDIDLPDTQSKLWTNFNFLVTDKYDSINVMKTLTIKIKSEGPNGKAFRTITGSGH